MSPTSQASTSRKRIRASTPELHEAKKTRISSSSICSKPPSAELAQLSLQCSELVLPTSAASVQLSPKCILQGFGAFDQGIKTEWFCCQVARWLRDLCDENAESWSTPTSLQTDAVLFKLRNENVYEDTMTLEETVRQLLSSTMLCPVTIIAALAVMTRVCHKSPELVRDDTVEGIFCMCALLAGKTLEDALLKNGDIFLFGPFPCIEDISSLEFEFLCMLDWNVNIDIEEYRLHEEYILEGYT